MNDEVLAELREIKFHLSLLTHSLRSKAFKAFEAEMLKTEARIKMWYAFDGKLNPSQIGAIVGATGQTVRNMIQDGEISHFLRIELVNSAQIASRDIDAVLDWYLSNHPEP